MIRKHLKKPHIKRLALLYLFGSITFAVGLVFFPLHVFPQTGITLYDGNTQSVFLIVGSSFFIIGSILGLKGK